jgi:tRNA threonylcarbamoyladenosine biosynthesis protein TsaB
MRVLAIDTPGREGAVALLAEGLCVAGAELGTAQEHAERVLGALEGLLAEREWRPEDLDLVVVSLGPGSFTGVRVGMAAGQGIAFGVDRPLVGVPSLTLMAAWAALVMEGQGGLYVPLIDARRGELYAGAWRPGVGPDDALVPVLAPLAVPPTQLREVLGEALAAAGPGPPVFCGDGVPLVAEQSDPGRRVSPRPVKTVNPPRPSGCRHAARTAGERVFRAEGAPPLLEPLYVRPPDAWKPAAAPPPGPAGAPLR